MLAGCRAYLVAKNERQTRSLHNLARAVGFSYVASVLGDDAVSLDGLDRAVVFFLVHYELGDEVITSVLAKLRSAPSDAVRYAPAVLVIDDCPFETILKYVRFGFDDIITLPDKRTILADRLVGQLNCDHTYFETADYLGPDRRRMELSGTHERRGSGSCMRLTIHRTIEQGVRVMRREFIGPRREPYERMRAGAV
jgi:hypothetical protein